MSMHTYKNPYEQAEPEMAGKSITDIVTNGDPELQHAIVYLTGFSFFRGTPYDGPMEESIRDMINRNQFPAVVESFTSPIPHKATKNRAKNFIEQNRKGEGKVILVGYSWGGDNAVEISHDPDFPEIDLLITIDPSNGKRVDRQESFRVGSRAKEAINLYQPNVDATKSGNRYISGADNRYIRESEAFPKIKHGNADEAAQDEVVKIIENKLSR